MGDPSLLVRTADAPSAVTGRIRSAIQGLAPELPFIAVEPMTSRVQDDLLPYRIGAALSTLFGVSPTDPVALGGMALVPLGVAVVASWPPARRAVRVDSLRALRAE